MIVILFENDCRPLANTTAGDLKEAFSDNVSIALVSAESAAVWPTKISWDDLLIVIFRSGVFPASGTAFIAAYLHSQLRAEPNGRMLLPVAASPDQRIPPGEAATVKALQYDETAGGSRGRLATRVGGMLGLRLQGRDTKIFISYRALDGATIAQQLYDHLNSLGYRPWRDQALEIDGETKILPGSPVQAQIDAALRGASIVLLIDTKAAPESPWIKHEVDTADSRLIPILPICIREVKDPKQGPRFRSLVALQRWVQFQFPAGNTAAALTLEQLDMVTNEAETYLCEIFRRRCRVPFIVKEAFSLCGFSWGVLDSDLLMFESKKDFGKRFVTRVLSHCSVFDQVYPPALAGFFAYIKDLQSEGSHMNYSLFIYDGELLPDSELTNLVIPKQGEIALILHHQELAVLISSNFTALSHN